MAIILHYYFDFFVIYIWFLWQKIIKYIFKLKGKIPAAFCV